MNTDKTNGSLSASLWNFFASVKLTVGLLLLLAGTSVIGTLIPQNANPADYVRAYGEIVYRILHVLDLFDMYYSWWFQLLIGLLTINIVVCTVKRWPAIWKIVSAVDWKIAALTNRKPLSEYSDRRKPEELDPLFRKIARRRLRKYQAESSPEGFRIMAEKGRWTRLAVPVVHLSIVIVLAGAMVGSLLGFDGFVNIPEGESADHIRLRNSNATLPLGFEVRCDDFNVSFYDTGAPKEFRSRLVILENGQPVVEKDIIVNDPLRYRGINFFQSSYGQMASRELLLSFTSKESGKVYRRNASVGQTVDLPENAGRLTVREYKERYLFRGKEVGEAVLTVLEKPGKDPIELALLPRFPSFDKMRQGDWIIAVEKQAERYYTGLQVTRDPGVPLVYAGFILLIAGCWVAFFMSHQKIVLEVRQSANSSRIKVFGSANRNRLGFEQRMRKLTEELKKL